MVQNTPAKRGRPRAYDPATALRQAMELFWSQGYAATSLDGLSEVTGMNRPSLYGAFGDKRALYLRTLNEYRANGALAIGRALALPTLRAGLAEFYRSALELYLSGDSPRGCFLIGTAAVEAVQDEEVRTILHGALADYDFMLEARMIKARDEGELPADADVTALAKIASAALYSLAIRSRGGDSRENLEKTAAAAINLVCGRLVPSPLRGRGQG